MEVCITNYGARVVSILVPDKMEKGRCSVWISTIGEYMEQRQNFGSTVGRYIGRILNARFTLDGVEHKLVPNNGKSGHISHGGNPGLPIEYGKWNRQIHIRFVCLISPLMEKMVSPET